LIKFVFVVVFLASPFIARAGFFDTISGWFSGGSNTALADEGVSEARVSLLEAATNSNPTSTTTIDNLSVVNGKALLSEVGVTGTIADVADSLAPDQISVYVVHKGDTLASVAKMYNVSPNTIKWANDIKGAIKEGDILTILPISGIEYVVKKGDTVSLIAKKYSADATEIQEFNDVDLNVGLKVGQTIIIPDAVPAVAIAPTIKKTSSKTQGSSPSYAGYYMNPLPGARKSQGLHGYNGIDLAGPAIGTPVLSSAKGTVILAKFGGYNGGYGNYVVVSHPNGTQTLYAHLNSVSVSRGEVVLQGQKLGGMGNTGRSTGKHLHFEVRGAKNPF
jgi:LysM repeat protein